MIHGKRVLAVVPARGGSKVIPRKNIIKINGKPLIGYTLEEAEKSDYIDRIVVSTDDDEIREVVEGFGDYIPFMRPKELATDSAKSIDVILHVLKIVNGFDYVMMLQPTTPLRKKEDIDQCIQAFLKSDRKSSVSLSPSSKHPEWMFNIKDSEDLIPYKGNFDLSSRRQEQDPVYVLNGAIYLAEITYLIKNKTFIDKQTLPYIMPTEHSIDIDTLFDVRVVECLLRGDG